MNKIKNEFLSLDNKHRELLIKSLSQTERRRLLQCIQEHPVVKKTDEVSNKLFDKIKNARICPISISRKKDRKSIIALLERKLQGALDQVAYFFGILTARKTQRLASKSLSIIQVPSNGDAKSISRFGLRNILKKERQTNPRKRIDLKTVLENNGYSPIIEHCTFKKAKIFLRIDLEGIVFKECEFDWCHFSNNSISEVTFDACSFFNTSFLNAKIEKCNFNNCNLQEVMFTGAKIHDSNFSSCSIIGSSFEDASIVGTAYLNSSLPATHFLEAFAKDSHFVKCNLKDTIFFGTLDNFSVDDDSKKTVMISGPTTAILVDPESRGITTPKAYMKLDQAAHTIPLRVALRSEKTTPKAINNEIQSALSKIGNYDRNKPPIPQQLIKNITDNPFTHAESIKILKKAEKLATEVDSFFLPGGEDIPPSLYGQQEEQQTNWGSDYRRSILELGIIHQSFNKGIPLMAVCRGFQMSNIYFGAQLLQDVKGHKGIQNFQLTYNTHKGLYYNALKDSMLGAVFHHQAVSKESGPTENLEPAVIYKNLIKASELRHAGAAPMILLQFHPEFYKASTAHTMKREWIDKGLESSISESNEAFWDILSDSAKAYRIKKIALSTLTEQSALIRGAQRFESDFGAIPERLLLEKLKNQRATIKKLEVERAKTFELFKERYYSNRKLLLTEIINTPERAERYLRPTDDNEIDSYIEERAILIDTLKRNKEFAKKLGKQKLSLLISIIQEVNPELSQELASIDHLKRRAD